MSKRTRGQQRRRPGARPPTVRPSRPSRPGLEHVLDAGTLPLPESPNIARSIGATPAPPTLVDTDTARPATKVRTGHPRARAKPGSLLASRAATEYVYVAQDLRRIALVAVILFGILIALWILLVLMGISALY